MSVKLDSVLYRHSLLLHSLIWIIGATLLHAAYGYIENQQNASQFVSVNETVHDTDNYNQESSKFQENKKINLINEFYRNIIPSDKMYSGQVDSVMNMENMLSVKGPFAVDRDLLKPEILVGCLPSQHKCIPDAFVPHIGGAMVPVYQPVCANDGNTYLGECAMKLTNSFLEVEYQGFCKTLRGKLIPKQTDHKPVAQEEVLPLFS